MASGISTKGSMDEARARAECPPLSMQLLTSRSLCEKVVEVMTAARKQLPRELFHQILYDWFLTNRSVLVGWRGYEPGADLASALTNEWIRSRLARMYCSLPDEKRSSLLKGVSVEFFEVANRSYERNQSQGNEDPWPI